MAQCMVDDGNGCKEIQDHDKTLYDEEYGLTRRMLKVEEYVKSGKERKKSVRNAVLGIAIGSLFIFVAIFITLNTMWAETRDIPDRRKRMIQVEKDVAILKDNYMEIKNGQKDILTNATKTNELLLKLLRKFNIEEGKKKDE